MTTSADHESEWESQADVDACLRETGVTHDQVNRWRREGLLPPVVQKPTAYRGSEVLYPGGTCAQIRAAQALFREKSRIDYVGLRLWRRGFWVNEDYWRPRLRRFGRLADRILPFVLRLRSRVDRNETGETLQEKAARHPASNIIFSRIKGRLWGEDRAIFYRVLMELGLGEFERFDAPGGDETRSRDEAEAIEAFDIGNSEKHEILGKKLNLIGALPSALENAAIALRMGNLAQAADAPAEEIAKARDDARNAFQIGLSLYQALEWVYGPEAFGLRFAAWFTQKAPDAVIDGLTLPTLRLRKIPGAIHSSENIAKMAKQANDVRNASMQFKRLWQRPQVQTGSQSETDKGGVCRRNHAQTLAGRIKSR